jgi:hypothetical protein
MFNPLVGGPPVSSGQQPSAAPDLDRNYGGIVVIDGTPVRVVMLAIAAAASLTALRWAGFRFNVGVSN